MVFLSCSDETSKLDFIIFPNKYNLVQNIEVGDIINVFGKVEKRLDNYQLVVSKIIKLNKELR